MDYKQIANIRRGYIVRFKDIIIEFTLEFYSIAMFKKILVLTLKASYLSIVIYILIFLNLSLYKLEFPFHS